MRDLIAQFNQHLDRTVNDLTGPDSLTEAVRYQLESGGKRLRPGLMLWVAEAAAIDRRLSLNLALCLELLHNVLLIHDDIEDGDRIRRNLPTLWSKIGIDKALNASDLLAAELFLCLARLDVKPEHRTALVEAFAQVFRITVEGQALDIENRGQADFDLATYDEIIQKKTGYYLALAWVVPGLISGFGHDRERQWEVGRWLGPAFQIKDDLLDLTRGKGRGEIGSDVREGKPSILYAFALERGQLSEESRSELVSIHRESRESTSGAMVERAIQTFRDCGAIDYAEAECLRRAQGGIERFKRLSFVNETMAEQFESFATYLTQRLT